MHKHSSPTSNTSTKALATAILTFLAMLIFAVLAITGLLTKEILESLISLLRVAIGVLNSAP